MVRSIQIKALVLALVFASNPLISFACSVEMANTRPAAPHSHDNEVHQREGKDHSRHHHQHIAVHSDSPVPHSHTMAPVSRVDHGIEMLPATPPPGENTGCCSDQVVDFSYQLKLLPQNNFELPTPALFAMELLPFFEKYMAGDRLSQDLQPPRSWPPGHDIDLRIVIQSFQI